MKKESINKINGVSLFSSAGIAETYINKHNIDIIVANELIPQRAKFYQDKYPNTKMITGDITNFDIYSKILKESKKNKCNFVIATPPCQGMSIAGKMKDNDPRNDLIIKAVEFIKDLKPEYAIIENVPGMIETYIKHKDKKNKIIDFINKELKNYKINYSILNAADYGTPQNRKRAIILMSKNNIWEFPSPNKNKITVRDAISHLPSLESGQESNIKYHYAKKHNDRHILWIKNTPTGKTALNNKKHFPQKEDGTKIKGYSTTYKRIDWDKPAPTITMANGSISSQNNVHPGRLQKNGTYSDARVLTLKELFILTGLPESWEYPKWASDNLVRQIIGEGVPPKLIDSVLKTLPNKNKNI